MHPKRSACAQQQRRVRSHAHNSDAYAFFNLLTSPGLLGEVESLLPEHRERLFLPTETLSGSGAVTFGQRLLKFPIAERQSGTGVPSEEFCRSEQYIDKRRLQVLALTNSGEGTWTSRPDSK